MTTATILDAARAAYAPGLCLLPTRDDGSKAPDVSRWTAFQTTRPTIDQMRAFDFAHRSGFGVIAGAVSGFRECWDFDCLDTYHAFVTAAQQCGLGDVVQRIRDGFENETPNGGRRWIVTYPADVVWKDCTLARRPGRAGEPAVKTLIELPTFAIVAPSNGGTHPSGKPYVQLAGGFNTIASYSANERASLMALAKSFDAMPRPAAEPPRATRSSTKGDRPGDVYNARMMWPALLEPAGWVHVSDRGVVSCWRRPGKTHGISATTNIGGSDLFFPFTSSTEFEADKSYSKFGVYAVLHHGGDFRRAARALAQQYPEGSSERPEHPGAEPASEPAASFVERFPAFCARLRDRTLPPDVVPSLVPRLGLVLAHGQPRSLKTWAAQELARAASTGTAAFALERFQVATALETWYLTEEDPELAVRDRFTWLFAGRAQTAPSMLHVSVQKAIRLDDVEWQQRTIAYAQAAHIAFTIVDPLRASSDAVDQGPRELKPLAAFLRTFMRETGSAVLLVHHDVKPPAGKPDDRARPQRASGGGIFSIADAPIHTELVTDGQAMLVPAFYKFTIAPAPFLITVTTDDSTRPTWARVTGEDTSATAASDLVLDTKVRDCLRARPGMSGSKVAQAIHANKSQTLAVLDRLFAQGVVDSVQRGQARLWFLKAEEEKE